MTFVTPWTALLAASITVPLLLLLYFLKLRRRPLRIASTLLWRKTFEDLQVNVPFQRLRFTALLLLQMLLLATLLLALAQPRLESGEPPASRLILLIDRSASMSALTDSAGRTRLDEAKDAAAELIDRLGRGREASQMMLVAFGASAQVVSGFESQRRTLSERLDAITPTDEEANLDLALQLAGAFAGTGEDQGERPPDVVLISDGGVAPPADPAGFRLRAGNFRFLRVGPGDGEAIENLGVAAFSARRDYDDPARVLVFARLVNASSQPVETTVRLEAMGRGAPVTLRRTVPAARGAALGELPITHAFDLPEGALLRAGQGRTDALASDDAASVVLPPPAKPRIALVHPGDGADPFLRDLLAATDPRELRELSAEAFATIDASALDAGEELDLVVFDRVASPRLPGIPTISFGALPAGLAAIEARREGGQRILSWDRQHPVMRHVALDTILFVGAGGMKLPATAMSLASGPDGPVIAVLRTRGARHVVVGFELMRSNWPLHVSFTVFLRNALDYLTLAASGQQGLSTRPGDSLTVRALPGVSEVVIDGPQSATVKAEPGEAVTLPVLRRAGVYRVQGVQPPWDQVAVSVLSDVESDLRPPPAIEVNAVRASAATVAEAAPRELWPWLTAFAAGLLALEWLFYCRRLRR